MDGVPGSCRPELLEAREVGEYRPATCGSVLTRETPGNVSVGAQDVDA